MSWLLVRPLEDLPMKGVVACAGPGCLERLEQGRICGEVVSHSRPGPGHRWRGGLEEGGRWHRKEEEPAAGWMGCLSKGGPVPGVHAWRARLHTHCVGSCAGLCAWAPSHGSRPAGEWVLSAHLSEAPAEAREGRGLKSQLLSEEPGVQPTSARIYTALGVSWLGVQ